MAVIPRHIRRFPIIRLVLAILIAGLWLRSYSYSDVFTFFVRHGKAHSLVSDQGRLGIFISNISLGEPQAYTYDAWHMTSDEFAEARSMVYETGPLPIKVAGVWLGASPANAFGVPGGRYWFIAVPFGWLEELAGGALLFGLGKFWRRRKWGTAAFCGGCGYDIRASDGRCPECGALIPRGRPHSR